MKREIHKRQIVNSSILFIFFLFSLSLFSQVPSNGLVAHYPFSGSANDLSSNGNNGVVTSAVLTADRFGNPNSAYSFNGSSSYIKVSNASVLNNNEFTYSLWVKPNTLPTNGNSSNIFEIGSQIGGYYGQVCSMNNNYSSTTGWRITSGNADYTTVGFQNGILPNNNTWYHLTITRNDSIVRLYIDCQYVIGMVNNGLLPYYNSPLDMYIGRRADGSLNQYFNGVIDDIRIYDRALSQTEISALCNESICFQTISVTDTLVINMGISGFNPLTYNNSIKIYPNPAHDHITIDYGNYSNLNGYTLKITNSLSQTVFNTAINQQQSYIDLAGWNGNGIYFAHLIDMQGNTIDIKKIVLQ